MGDPPKRASTKRHDVTQPGYVVPHLRPGADDEATTKKVQVPSIERAAQTAASGPPVIAPTTDKPAGLPPAPDGARRGGRSARGEPDPRTAIEVAFVTDDDSLARGDAWRAVEIWTRNRVYSLDGQLTCIEVVNRATGVADAKHSLLGARLSGGQKRGNGRLEIAHPLPVPGTEAVFRHDGRKHARFGQTSEVERVVIRVRWASVPSSEPEPVWESITGRHRVPRG